MPKIEQLRRWQEALQEMDEGVGIEFFGPPQNISMEAEWVAQDLAQAAGWLVAIGAEQELPAHWRVIIGGRVALAAGRAVTSDLQGVKEELSTLLKVPPPPGLSPEEKLVYILGASFKDLLAADENAILHQRLWCWAGGVALHQASHCDPLGNSAYKAAAMIGVRLTIADDPGAQYVRLLSVLEQAEAEADEALADPVISAWLQEEVLKVKQEPLVKAVIGAEIAELPKIFL